MNTRSIATKLAATTLGLLMTAATAAPVSAASAQDFTKIVADPIPRFQCQLGGTYYPLGTVIPIMGLPGEPPLGYLKCQLVAKYVNGRFDLVATWVPYP